MRAWFSTVLAAHVSCVEPTIFKWLPTYKWKEHFLPDLVAGITTFMFVIAQGTSQAMIAGLPLVYGLYASTLPAVMYVLLGGSREAAVGPATGPSLFLGMACAGFDVPEGSDDYVNIALNVTMLSAIISYLLGIFRVGALVNLLGPPVLSGFLTAVAMLTVISPGIKYILGLKLPSSLHYTHEKLLWLALHLPSTNVYSLCIGVLSCVALYAVKKLRETYKPTPERMAQRWYRWVRQASNLASVAVLIFGGVAGYVFRGMSGIPPFTIIGEIKPVGLKVPSFHFIGDFETFLQMVGSSFALSLVCISGHWAVVRRYAVMNGYDVDINQELMAMGLLNIFGTLLVNSFVSAVSIPKTAVNVESGAVTQMSQLIGAVLMVVALYILIPTFYYIPDASLGAVVVISVLSMVDIQAMVHAYKTDKRDFVVIVLTFLLTFFVGVVEGIAAGMLLSLAFVLKTSAFPEIVTLGVIPGSTYFKNVAWYPECEQIPGVAIVRMDATLYFANCAHFKEAVHDAALGLFHTSAEPVRYVVLDASVWTDLDVAALNTLSDIHAELLSFQVQLAFAHVKHVTHECLLKIKFIEKIGGESHLFSSIADAVDALPAREQAMEDEVAATMEVRAEEVRRAAVAEENVLYGDGLRVLDDEIRLMERAGPLASPQRAPLSLAWSPRGPPVYPPFVRTTSAVSGSHDGDSATSPPAGGLRRGTSFRFSQRAVAAAATGATGGASVGSSRGLHRGSGSMEMEPWPGSKKRFSGSQRRASGSPGSLSLDLPRWRSVQFQPTDAVLKEGDVAVDAAPVGSANADATVSSPHFLQPKAGKVVDVEGHGGDGEGLKER